MFPCDRCGACCRHVGMSALYSDLDRGDGVCKYLRGNLCSIYNKRPLKCNIDACYDRFFRDKMRREEFYRLNWQWCQRFKAMEEE